jgi:hypothetical protein
MLIVDKNDDFYDHYSHIYGVDKQIVFDRRGSIIISDEIFCTDIRINYRRHFDRIMYLLEVGYKQYLIELTDITITKGKGLSLYDDKIKFDAVLFKTFDEQKHLFDKEMTLCKIHVPYDYRFYYNRKDSLKDKIKDIKLQEIKILDNHVFKLPILKDTKLTKILDAETIWKDLNVYVSSCGNDKDVAIINTDKDKIVNHGFDTKTSFRNPIK